MLQAGAPVAEWQETRLVQRLGRPLEHPITFWSLWTSAILARLSVRGPIARAAPGRARGGRDRAGPLALGPRGTHVWSSYSLDPTSSTALPASRGGRGP